ncbi:estradiol 17-beta-dehydrogenase 12-A [Culex quinquefasciatus]|uniref:Estradiol 17-beta-dehydrogenase 12-A n=1 Tax=Culex quinquefasciatus TaxID=7176 RepID=B0XGY1_CULQU|nr:inactive hydroxysteroid dehydrogenase-like protein 1 [Culex quinquefasciatus]EDS27900.1 estradiol 17-beta-dehydrogenase 12-A [Culex quinquefasciatus]|eukprot:XP_001868903.1 estradiol 17-beta-dehydrogenase 12-A [Culex quinquefasciatus]
MFWWIGVYATLLWAYNGFLESLLAIVWGSIRAAVRREKLTERYGPWAVITGATDGIGKCYAQNLAAKGLNIALLSRSRQKLDRVGDELEKSYGVQTKRVVVDFNGGHQIYEQLREQLAAMDIGLLVNNVGYLPELATLEQHTEQDLLTVVNLNVVAATVLSRIVIPGMRERGRGIVINIGSSSGHVPVAYMAAYAASKAYLHNLGLALGQELRGSGVEFQVVAPSIVRTNLSEQYESKMPWYVTVLDVEQMARFAVFTIGKTAYTSGHWQHCLQVLWQGLVPLSLAVKIVSRVLHKGARRS